MKIGILGSGAYGIALSSIAHKNNISIEMWTFDEEEKQKLEKTKISPKLSSYKIPDEIKFSTDMKSVVKDKDLIIIAVPAFAFDNVSIEISKYLQKQQHILIATKGIENDTCLFLTDVFLKYNKHKNYAVISGPTFASDIVQNSPIGFSLATKSKKTEKIIRMCFENSTTKFRTTDDIIGVEICGSIKNVMAIASGILEGMKVTDSTRALFLTESMNDIKELIDKLGGNKKTIVSFAGFGDFLMTCTSQTSRNFSFGYLIGSNKSREEIDNYKKNTTVEGLYTLNSIHKLVRNKKVKMPIINLIYDIINKGKDKEELLKFLIEKK